MFIWNLIILYTYNTIAVIFYLLHPFWNNNNKKNKLTQTLNSVISLHGKVFNYKILLYMILKYNGLLKWDWQIIQLKMTKQNINLLIAVVPLTLKKSRDC